MLRQDTPRGSADTLRPTLQAGSWVQIAPSPRPSDALVSGAADPTSAERRADVLTMYIMTDELRELLVNAWRMCVPKKAHEG